LSLEPRIPFYEILERLARQLDMFALVLREILFSSGIPPGQHGLR
jgi:hypothetical protein